MAWTWIIGDVHGRHDLLATLLGLIATERDGPLVFVGDLIDHGPAAAAVLDTVITKRAGSAETVVLPGNHERLLHRAVFGPRDQRGELLKVWLGKGGATTLRSLGIEPPARPPARKPEVERLRDLIVAALDPFVRHWLEHRFEAPIWHDVGASFRVVHAGFRPGIATERQKLVDLLEIREPFLSADRLWDGRVVVHGHTARREPKIEVLPTRINVDTGAGKGVGLAALAVDGARVRDVIVACGDGAVMRGQSAMRGRPEVIGGHMGTTSAAA